MPHALPTLPTDYFNPGERFAFLTASKSMPTCVQRIQSFYDYVIEARKLHVDAVQGGFPNQQEEDQVIITSLNFLQGKMNNLVKVTPLNFHDLAPKIFAQAQRHGR